MLYDLIIIGGGVIGALISRLASRYDLSILLIEKENDVGNGASSANSAIIHAGYDPLPFTNKAKFNVLGNKLFPSLCKELNVPLKEIGSLTIARSDDEIKILYDLVERAKINGVDVNLLNREELRIIEPNLSDDVLLALEAKSAKIVNPFLLVSNAIIDAYNNGLKIALGEEVTAINFMDNLYEIKTTKNTYFAKMVINSAGINSDKIAKMLDKDFPHSITPRKGEYFVLDKQINPLVNHVIFPLPSSKGKGILIIPTTSTNVLIGPSSEFCLDKDDTATDKSTLDEVLKSASSMLKSLPISDNIRVFSGLRPTSSNHDFYLESDKNHSTFINLVGIESPGLASSPAIAEFVLNQFVLKELKPKLKERIVPFNKKQMHVYLLDNEEATKIIQKNPLYGKIICNCEKVSEGEIIDELDASPFKLTYKGLRKRLRIGFGRCQGGFCAPKVVNLMAKYYHTSPLNILYDRDNSNILVAETKSEEN